MGEEIRKKIEELLSEMSINDIGFIVEHPNDLSHGDYACNVALVLSKKLGKNPREIAEGLKEKLEDTIQSVESISIAGPGFLNFQLKREFFTNKTKEILDTKEDWGKNVLEKDQLVLLEYTSPNLFKPLHVGNLVGNIIGESLTRIFEYSGADVKRLNFPSDIGLTVAKGVWGLKRTKGDAKDILALGDAYQAGNDAYENDEEAKKEIMSVNQMLYAGSDDSLNSIRKQGIETSRKSIGELCRVLGTTFDTEIFESQVGDVGLEVVQKGLEEGVFELSEGAIVYKGDKVGLHTRVFVNSQGLPTYEAKDMGNFLLKQKAYPKWQQSYVITGGEQREYFKVITAAIKELFSGAKDKKIEHIPTGFLTLTTGKMSSRKGNVLTGESLLEEVQNEVAERIEDRDIENKNELGENIAVAALKYQILRQSVGSDIVFDKERALNFEGDSGPYLQYTNARIHAVLEKANILGIKSSCTKVPSAPYEIEKILYQFPEVIQKTLHEKSPHHLVGFLTELAGSFNTFYAHEKIADVDDNNAPYKVALTKAIGQTLENGLYLLGIKSPKQM